MRSDYKLDDLPFVYDQHATVRIYLESRKLSIYEARSLQAKVKKYPNDLESRVKLLGNYGGRQYFSRAIRNLRAQHIFWVIENFPDSYLAGMNLCEIYYGIDPANYATGSEMWNDLAKSYPCNEDILGNAANYFAVESRERAIAFYKQAHLVEPLSYNWPDKIAFQYDLMMHLANPEEKVELAQNALKWYEKAYSLGGIDIGFRHLVGTIAVMAAWLGYGMKARSYAYELLIASDEGESDEYWNASLHNSFCALGLIALREGDIVVAKDYLQQGGYAASTVNPRSTIYNLALAEELFALGEFTAVEDYIRLAVTGGGPRTPFVRFMKRLEKEPLSNWPDLSAYDF